MSKSARAPRSTLALSRAHAGLYSSHLVLPFVLNNRIARDECHKQARAVYKSTESLRSENDDASEFQEAIQKNDNYLLRRILYYTGNIVGSSAYWRQVRQKLRALIDYKATCYLRYRDDRAADLDALLAWLSKSCVAAHVPTLVVIVSACVSCDELVRRDETKEFAILSSLTDDDTPRDLQTKLKHQLDQLEKDIAAGHVPTPMGPGNPSTPMPPRPDPPTTAMPTPPALIDPGAVARTATPRRPRGIRRSHRALFSTRCTRMLSND